MKITLEIRKSGIKHYRIISYDAGGRYLNRDGKWNRRPFYHNSLREAIQSVKKLDLKAKKIKDIDSDNFATFTINIEIPVLSEERYDYTW